MFVHLARLWLRFRRGGRTPSGTLWFFHVAVQLAVLAAAVLVGSSASLAVLAIEIGRYADIWRR